MPADQPTIDKQIDEAVERVMVAAVKAHTPMFFVQRELRARLAR